MEATPTSTFVGLLVIVGLLVVLRLVLPSLPLARFARPMSRLGPITLAGGALGLTLHCAVMFYPGVFGSFGTGPYASTVNRLGPGSIALFVIPGVLLLVGLRRQRAVVLVALTAALVAVGITMYDHGPLGAHLTAISVLVILLALSVSVLTGAGGARRRTRGSSSSRRTRDRHDHEGSTRGGSSR